jgi:hypothetical protein
MLGGAHPLPVLAFAWSAQERIALPFRTDRGTRAMAAQEGAVIAQRQQFFGNAADQRGMVAVRVRPEGSRII